MKKVLRPPAHLLAKPAAPAASPAAKPLAERGVLGAWGLVPAGQQQPQPARANIVIQDEADQADEPRRRDKNDLLHCLNETLRYGRRVTENVEQAKHVMKRRHVHRLRDLAKTIQELLDHYC